MTLRSVVLLALAVSPLSAAPLEPQTKTPYRWRVVVRVLPHPTLSPVVRQQLCRDLGVSLKDDLGKELGTVDVIDLEALPVEKREPLWTSFITNGWPALEREEFRKLTGLKTHFVQLEVQDGRYLLSARQHDGDSGLLSPMVRTSTTRDVAKLGRLAGLLVVKDFGPVGTVERVAGDATAAKVKFRGGELPGFENQIKVGDVLSFSAIREQPRPQPKGAKPPRPGQTVPVEMDQFAQSRDFNFIRITEVGLRGEFRGQVLTRWAQPFTTGRNVIGYRAMKLATVEAPLTVRLADEKGKAHPADFRPQVWAGEGHFTDNPSDRESFRGLDGVYQSLKPVKGLACVTIGIGASKRQGFPVPVLGMETPTVLKFNIDEKEIAKAEFESQCESASRRVSDLELTQTELFRGLSALITSGDFKTALDRANKGLKTLTETDAQMVEELKTLGENPLAKEPSPRRTLAVCQEKLQALRSNRPSLEKKIEDLKSAIARAEDPVRFERDFKADELRRELREFESRGEIPQALDVLDRLFELTKQDDVKARRDKLAQEWAPKSEEHQKARSFLIDEWRKASDLAEFTALAGKLADTVTVFEANKDRLGLLNLRGSIIAAGTRLKDLLEFLDPASDTDAQKIKDLKSVDEILSKTDKMVSEALEKLQPKK